MCVSVDGRRTDCVLNLRYVITGTNRNATWRSAVLDLIKYLSVIWTCSQTQQCSNTRLQLQSHQSVNLPESWGQGKLQFQNLKKKKQRWENMATMLFIRPFKVSVHSIFFSKLALFLCTYIIFLVFKTWDVQLPAWGHFWSTNFPHAAHVGCSSGPWPC